MPNTGEDREIIHIQAPTIHKVFIADISILWGLGLNLGAPGFASLQITCQNLVGYITDIRKCVLWGLAGQSVHLQNCIQLKTSVLECGNFIYVFFVMRQF
jgi:hypothetical protein